MGAVNVNETGNQLSDRQLAVDMSQAIDGKTGDDHGPEAQVEVLDDQAGRRIGGRINNMFGQNSISTQEWRNLRSFVRQELCTPE